jgi:hypothetical protein
MNAQIRTFVPVLANIADRVAIATLARMKRNVGDAHSDVTLFQAFEEMMEYVPGVFERSERDEIRKLAAAAIAARQPVIKAEPTLRVA